jgi:glutamine---fructose-6-phosphate transaminase (isomerizing)
LIDENIPVIVLAPHNKLWDKINANIHEVMARDGKLLVFTDIANHKLDKRIITVQVPKTIPELTPLVYILPLQLLAYHVAALRGTDIDQPRNLAKSVTVE